MELGFVSTGGMHFGTGIDQEVGLGAAPDEEVETLLGTKLAVVGAKGFHRAERGALPDLVECLDVADQGRGWVLEVHQLVDVVATVGVCLDIGGVRVVLETADIPHVLLHAEFEVTLGGADV